MALTTKAKIAVAAAAAILLVGGGVAVVNFRTPAHPSVRLSADLAEDYELREGENIRFLRPPFPAKRDELLKSHVNHSGLVKGLERWDCVFDWYDGELRWRAGSQLGSERERLNWIAENVLGLEWYNLGDHGPLPVFAGDWVVRADLTLEQKVEGYAQALEHASGQEVSFERTQVRRDCIVRRAEPVSSISEQADPLALLLTTSSPPFSEDMPSTAVGHTISFQTWCARAGLPFIDETTNPLMPGAMYAIMPDADLKRGDPKLRTKLNRVLRNLEYQTGGTFEVESRAVEVWTPVVQ